MIDVLALPTLPTLVATTFTLVCTATLLYVPVPVPVPDSPSPSLERAIFILRPVENPDAPWLSRIANEAAALSTAHLARGATVTVIVCGPEVAARAAPYALAAANSDVTENDALNRKVRHLAAGARLASTLADEAGCAAHAVIVQIDADVTLEAADVAALLATLDAGGPNDIAFAFPALAPGSSFASWLADSILMSSPQSFAVVAGLARLTRSPAAVAGKCVAMRLSTLADFGGYAAIESAIGDDVVLMERIHALGGVARPIPHAVLTRSADTTLASLVARMTRWLRVIRAQRPYLLLTYPTLIAPLPLAITLALTTSQRGPWAWACVGFLLAARTLLAVALALGPYRGGRAMRSAFATPLLAVLADAVLLVAFLAALAERRILWAGRIYDVRSGGRISGVRST